MTDSLITLIAATVVVAQAAIVLIIVGALLALVVPGVRARVREARQWLTTPVLWAAWIVAAVATAASLFFSEVANFLPCELCWYQRICMYPLVVILFFGALFRDRRVVWYALPLVIAGAAVSSWHIWLEQHPEVEACRVGIPCSVKWINELGYITIPVGSLTAFVLIGLLMLYVGLRSHSPGAPEQNDDAPEQNDDAPE